MRCGDDLRVPKPVVLVLLLAPVTAEYLIGYDDITGNAVALVFGVFFFAPLYGAPAVLIREVTRRRGLGWPTILLLAAAFGLIEAGLVDQSLFDPAYRDISYWDDLRDPTFLPWLRHQRLHAADVRRRPRPGQHRGPDRDGRVVVAGEGARAVARAVRPRRHGSALGGGLGVHPRRPARLDVVPDLAGRALGDRRGGAGRSSPSP